jgi:integrase
VPSEPLLLTWNDVDWEHDRLTVHTTKTAYCGKERRIIPIFPELKKPLEDVYNEAPPGTKHVISKYRNAEANLRTQLVRIIKRAGVEPWPKPWQNMRSSRETELAHVFPLYVACEWLGNTAAIANKHYLQVTERHFEAAQELLVPTM